MIKIEYNRQRHTPRGQYWVYVDGVCHGSVWRGLGHFPWRACRPDGAILDERFATRRVAAETLLHAALNLGRLGGDLGTKITDRERCVALDRDPTLCYDDDYCDVWEASEGPHCGGRCILRAPLPREAPIDGSAEREPDP